MATKESQAKHWEKKDKNIIQSYWDSPPAKKRSIWYADQLANFQFDSICEAGTFSGRNLHYISKAFPDVKISGFDVNNLAVSFAKKKLPNADIWNMNILDLQNLNKTFDIIFTSGTLIHLVPESVEVALKGMISVANKYILHLEDSGSGEVIKGPKHMKPVKKISDQIQYSHDIVKSYNNLGYSSEVIDLPDEVRTNGASKLIIVTV